MANPGKDLGAANALDENGAKVQLGSLWTDRRAVLVFVRYFDSASCRKLVSAMRDAQPEIEGRGARLVVVGGVKPEAMREFREAVGYRGPLVVDPSLDAFRLAGMVPGAAPKPAAAAAAPAAPAEPEPSGFFGRMKAAMNADVGKLLKMDVGEALTADLVKLGQQNAGADAPAAAPAAPSSAAPVTKAADSGVFVVGPGPATGFVWRAKGAGDLPKLADLLGALPKK
jgi:peroxiredoxin